MSLKISDPVVESCFVELGSSLKVSGTISQILPYLLIDEMSDVLIFGPFIGTIMIVYGYARML